MVFSACRNDTNFFTSTDKSTNVSKISVSEKARIAIKVSGKREVFEIKDPKPSEPRAAPNKVPRSLTADERLLLAKSIADKFTTFNGNGKDSRVKIEE